MKYPPENDNQGHRSIASQVFPCFSLTSTTAVAVALIAARSVGPAPAVNPWHTVTKAETACRRTLSSRSPSSLSTSPDHAIAAAETEQNVLCQSQTEVATVSPLLNHRPILLQSREGSIAAPAAQDLMLRSFRCKSSSERGV